VNYRHHFHAGNFADVMKHVFVIQLARALQRKPKGVLFLDTHAGRGSYDLELAGRGDSLAREPEHPAGIGRVWSGANTSRLSATSTGAPAMNRSPADPLNLLRPHPAIIRGRPGS